MASFELTHEKLHASISDNEVLLIDFWASWCGPCRSFGPAFEASSELHPDIAFAKVDTEAQRQIAADFGIRSIPTLAVFKKGQLVFKQPGALPAAALEDLIQQVQDFDLEAAAQAAQ